MPEKEDWKVVFVRWLPNDESSCDTRSIDDL